PLATITKMIYRIFLFFLFSLTSSCDSERYLIIDGQQYEFITGPGLIFIQDNLYADETEATNLMYLEFMDWTQEIFGENSDEFKKIQIDKSVWDNTKFSIEFGKDYFTHPDYGDYPVVGISLEQANLYSEWRTNRVAQLILIKKGLIKNEFTYSKDNYFTIDRYLNSDFDWIITKEDILVTEYKKYRQKVNGN
ncbi:hypothetical protein SAMN05421855_1521, partial [Ulvibacter litoralis]